MIDENWNIGEYVKEVKLEIIKEEKKGISRPRVRPVDSFDASIRVEFPRKIREQFPIGTQYLATVKVCQKHNADGTPRGAPYLRASNIELIPKSVPDTGLVAKVKACSISGLAYRYE